jgi:hypothetical protein
MNARELTNLLATLLRKEQTAMADFLVALSDFDREQLWRDLGHTSLFYFLRRELRLSAGAAQYRKTAAELIQRFPQVEVALRKSDLCLSTVVEVAKVITAENCNEVLPRFFGLSRRDAEMVAASIRPVEAAPRRDVVTTIRAAPAAAVPVDGADERRPLPASEPSPLEVRLAERALAANSPMTAPAAPAPRDSAEPLDAESSRLHVTVSRRFLQKLEAAKDALSHANPGASAEEILEAGLDLLLERHAKRKGLVAKPQKKVRPSKTDAIPAHVKRAVWKRAGGRCEWRLESGERCDSTTRLEFDHYGQPRARGGPPTIENIRLHCRPHNDMNARLAFGDEWMNRYTAKRRRLDATQPAAP